MLPDVLALLFWWRLPVAVARVSPGLASVMTDGVYLVRGTGPAALGPIVALAAGILAGTRHQGEAFTASLLTMAVLGTLGILSAHLGLWATAGFLVGELVIRQRVGTTLGTWMALLVSGVLLLLLTVYLPLLIGAARLTTRRIEERGQPPAFVEGLAAAVTAAAGATAWAFAARVLIRPVYAWQGLEPGTTELSVLLARWEGLAAVLAVAAAFRVWREHIGRGQVVGAHVVELRRALAGAARTGTRGWPVPARVAVGAAALTVLVSGLIGGPVQAVLAFGLFAALLWLRRRVAAAAWPTALLRVPWMLRAGLALTVGYGLSGLVLAASNSLGGALAATFVTTTLVTVAAAK